MSAGLTAVLLPSHRYRLAAAYREIAKVYREAAALHSEPALEDAARISEMTAQAFGTALDEPMGSNWGKEPTCSPT